MTAATETPTTNPTTHEEPTAFALPYAALADALTTVALAVPQRPALPAMGGVLLEGGADGCLSVCGFDFETAVIVRIPDAAETPGRVLLDHEEFTKILKALIKGMRKRDADALSVRVTADRSAAPTVELAGATIPLHAHPVQDYPQLPETPPTLARLERERFATEATRVLRTVGDEDTLPALSGIQVDFLAAGLIMAGTDRYRLAAAHVPAETEIPWQACINDGALLPGHPVAKIIKRFTAPTVEFGIQQGEDPAPLVSLTCGAVTMVMRCIDAEFPDYRALMPTSAARSITLDRTDALTQVQRAAAVLAAKRDRNQPVALDVETDGVRLAPALSAESQQVSTPAISAQVAGVTGPTRFHFKPDFLAEALESFAGPTVTLHTQDTANARVILTDSPVDLSDALAFRHLLMPIRLGD